MVKSAHFNDTEQAIEQKNIGELISAGYALELVLDHVVEPKSSDSNTDDVNKFYLHAKFNNAVRPINTQRHEHRNFTSVERALDWGKRLGFASATLKVNYADYTLSD